MARESTIQILYGGTTTGAPTDLSNGELAYAHGSKNLFVGANSDNTAVWVGAEILDEDTMSSNSDTALATQQSIKAYVNAQIGASAGVVSIEGLNGAILLDANTGITLATSGGDTITFSGTDATTSAKGVASFASADFSVVSGAVSLSDTVLKAITTDTGGMVMSGHAISLLGGEGMDVTHSGTAITVAGEDASTTNKGIASFTTGDFTALSGAISLNDAVVKSLSTDSGSLTPSSHSFSLNGATGMNVTHSGTSIDVHADIATTSSLGVASFSSNDFSVLAGGEVRIKPLSIEAGDIVNSTITNAKLQNSSVTIQGPGSSTAISLGGSFGFTGTANEVEVTESSGTVTIGLPNDVTIAGNLTVSGTVTTFDVANIVIEDPLIKLGKDNSGDAVDLGFYAQYNDGIDKYAGLARNRSVTDSSGNAEFFLFTEATSEPGTEISDTPTIATLRAKINGGTYT